MKHSSRAASNLYESVHQQLNMYALAAGAAGVSVLALAQPSEGKIRYTPTHVVIGGNQQYNLDLNRDGIIDFAIQNHENKGFCKGLPWRFYYLDPMPAIKGNGVIAPFSSFASALSPGAQIGHSRGFQSSRNPMAEVGSGFFPFRSRCIQRDFEYGPWLNVTNRYLGLKFVIKGKTHYGWARLSVQVGYVYITATLTGYAYETIPGKSIKAGQKKEAADDPNNENFNPGASLISPIPDKPQPASLGMLALGAQGVPLWRRKESALRGGLKGAS